MANHQALLERSDFNVRQSISNFADLLPEESTQEFLAILDEGKTVARSSRQAASDAVDSVRRSIATTVSMRWASWLMSSELSTEAKLSIEDLPFDDLALFAEPTDVRLHGLKDSRATLFSSPIYTGPPRKRFKPPQPHRPNSQARPGLYHKKGRDYKHHQGQQLGPASHSGSSRYPWGNKRAC